MAGEELTLSEPDLQIHKPQVVQSTAFNTQLYTDLLYLIYSISIIYVRSDPFLAKEKH